MRDEPTITGLEDETKIPTPSVLRPSIEKARTRTMKRPHAPFMEIAIGEDGKAIWDWPFQENGKDWKYLILDAFGTRHGNIAAVFVNQLVALSDRGSWSEKHQRWYPDDVELSALMAIVAAYRPRNEAQAALAAQIAATHLLTMKIAKRVSDYPYDAKMVSAYSKLARTSAVQAEAMMAIKGKRRTSSQSIAVTHEKHIHHHQHVHVAGGKGKNGRQPHAPVDSGTGENSTAPALLGDDTTGQIVPLRSGQGKEGLPDARRVITRRTEG
jgi:hypothetical protein